MTEQQASLTATKERLDAEMKQVEQEASQMETFKAQAQERDDSSSRTSSSGGTMCPFCSSKQDKQEQLDELLIRETAIRQQLQQLSSHSSDHQLTEEA